MVTDMASLEKWLQSNQTMVNDLNLASDIETKKSTHLQVLDDAYTTLLINNMNTIERYIKSSDEARQKNAAPQFMQYAGYIKNELNRPLQGTTKTPAEYRDRIIAKNAKWEDVFKRAEDVISNQETIRKDLEIRDKASKVEQTYVNKVKAIRNGNACSARNVLTELEKILEANKDVLTHVNIDHSEEITELHELIEDKWIQEMIKKATSSLETNFRSLQKCIDERDTNYYENTWEYFQRTLNNKHDARDYPYTIMERREEIIKNDPTWKDKFEKIDYWKANFDRLVNINKAFRSVERRIQRLQFTIAALQNGVQRKDFVEVENEAGAIRKELEKIEHHKATMKDDEEGLALCKQVEQIIEPIKQYLDQKGIQTGVESEAVFFLKKMNNHVKFLQQETEEPMVYINNPMVEIARVAEMFARTFTDQTLQPVVDAHKNFKRVDAQMTENGYDIETVDLLDTANGGVEMELYKSLGTLNYTEKLMLSRMNKVVAALKKKGIVCDRHKLSIKKMIPKVEEGSTTFSLPYDDDAEANRLACEKDILEGKFKLQSANGFVDAVRFMGKPIEFEKAEVDDEFDWMDDMLSKFKDKYITAAKKALQRFDQSDKIDPLTVANMCFGWTEGLKETNTFAQEMVTMAMSFEVLQQSYGTNSAKRMPTIAREMLSLYNCIVCITAAGTVAMIQDAMKRLPMTTEANSYNVSLIRGLQEVIEVLSPATEKYADSDGNIEKLLQRAREPVTTKGLVHPFYSVEKERKEELVSRIEKLMKKPTFQSLNQALAYAALLRTSFMHEDEVYELVQKIDQTAYSMAFYGQIPNIMLWIRIVSPVFPRTPKGQMGLEPSAYKSTNFDMDTDFHKLEPTFLYDTEIQLRNRWIAGVLKRLHEHSLDIMETLYLDDNKSILNRDSTNFQYYLRIRQTLGDETDRRQEGICTMSGILSRSSIHQTWLQFTWGALWQHMQGAMLLWRKPETVPAEVQIGRFVPIASLWPMDQKTNVETIDVDRYLETLNDFIHSIKHNSTSHEKDDEQIAPSYWKSWMPTFEKEVEVVKADLKVKKEAYQAKLESERKARWDALFAKEIAAYDEKAVLVHADERFEALRTSEGLSFRVTGGSNVWLKQQQFLYKPNHAGTAMQLDFLDGFVIKDGDEYVWKCKGLIAQKTKQDVGCAMEAQGNINPECILLLSHAFKMEKLSKEVDERIREMKRQQEEQDRLDAIRRENDRVLREQHYENQRILWELKH